MSLSLLLLFFNNFSYAQSSKVKYDSKVAKFSIVFSSEYEIEESYDEENKAKTTKIKSNSNEFFEMASYTLHTVELPDTKQLQQISLDAFVEVVKSKIISKKEWKAGENIGISTILKSEELDLILSYNVIIKDQIQYQIIAFSKANSWDEKKANKFVKSFKLNK